VPAELVEIAGIAKLRLVAVKVKGPPAEPSVVFWMATVAAFGVLTVLVKVQVIWAAATTLAAGMVSTLPTNAPKLAGLLVMAEFASVQLAVVAVKLAAGVSVKVTAVLKAVTVAGVGAAGVAVLTAVVLMAAGAADKFVVVKLKGPPIAPTVIFFNATVAGFAVFVNVQLIASP
jgi:hypothetical protein